MSKVQAFHIINESNGETKKLIAPQREQASRVQKCHIINDYNGETRKLMLSNCSNIDILNSINYSTLDLLVLLDEEFSGIDCYSPELWIEKADSVVLSPDAAELVRSTQMYSLKS